MQEETRTPTAASHEDGPPTVVSHVFLAFILLLVAVGIFGGIAAESRDPVALTIGMASATTFLGTVVMLVGCIQLVATLADRRGATTRRAAHAVLVLLAGATLAQAGWGAALGLALLAGGLVFADRLGAHRSEA